MARIPRSKIIDELVPGIYHVYSRTVRQTFLFGEDAVSGRSYGHRLDLLRDAVRTLSRLFAIDVIGFGFMLNHFHEILRNRPDLVRKMSNYQVALRTCLLNELGMNLKVVGQDRTPRQRASLRRKVEALMRDPKRLAKARADLSSISRYEQRLKAPSHDWPMWKTESPAIFGPDVLNRSRSPIPSICSLPWSTSI
jgi:hypothetical protein